MFLRFSRLHLGLGHGPIGSSGARVMRENREFGENPERAQRCDGDGLRIMPLGKTREGARGQMIRSQKTGQMS